MPNDYENPKYTSKNNPYQAGSTYYLSEDMKNLLADIP